MESFGRFLRVIEIIILVVGIACAKRNPQAKMRRDYDSFSLPPRQSNAKTARVNNAGFQKGNAAKLL